MVGWAQNGAAAARFTPQATERRRRSVDTALGATDRLATTFCPTDS